MREFTGKPMCTYSKLKYGASNMLFLILVGYYYFLSFFYVSRAHYFGILFFGISSIADIS